MALVPDDRTTPCVFCRLLKKQFFHRALKVMKKKPEKDPKKEKEKEKVKSDSSKEEEKKGKKDKEKKKESEVAETKKEKSVSRGINKQTLQTFYCQRSGHFGPI